MITRVKNAFFTVVLITSLISCNTGEMKDSKEHSSGETQDQKFIPGRIMKIYSVPAPLQVGTAIKAMNIHYYEKLLVPVNRVATYYSTNFLKAVNMGILTVDMGYATLYEQNQRALYYLNEVEGLSKEMDIQSGFERSAVERFKNNLHNRDSLYYILLESFGKMQKFLIASDRESAGIFVSTGSLIENLYLAAVIASENKDEKLITIVAMQQLFLDNMTELLQKYKDQKEVSSLLNEFSKLKEAYKGIEPVYPDWENNNLKTVRNVKISKEQLTKITEVITQIRKKAVG